IFPNPATSSITLQMNSPGQQTELQLFNLLGEQIKTVKVTDTSTVMNTDDVAAGIYICRVIRDKVVVGSGRLVVEK
ncbi:MAG: T9SS type A sorting domain-containing protein, partial [Bacteroidia bacterium]